VPDDSEDVETPVVVKEQQQSNKKQEKSGKK